MKKIRFDAPARLELRDAYRFHERRQNGLGKRLQAAVESMFQKIRANPGTGRIAPHGMRRCLVPDFPYYVVFENQDDYIYVYAVAHLRQDPDYWVDRLPGK